jgi:predicted membrane protein
VTLTDRPPQETTPTTPGRRTSVMPQIIGGGVLVLIGLLWLLERIGAIDISVTAVLALATMIIGISLMLMARDGPHVGLIVLGTILALAAWITAVAPFEGFQGGIGDRTIVVNSVDAIQPDYNVAMGKLTVDLTEIEAIGSPTSLTASVGMGELIVRVPEGTSVEVDARVGAGEVMIFDRVVDGVGLDETYRTPDFDASEEHFELQLEVLTGRVEVTDE